MTVRVRVSVCVTCESSSKMAMQSAAPFGVQWRREIFWSTERDTRREKTERITEGRRPAGRKQEKLYYPGQPTVFLIYSVLAPSAAKVIRARQRRASSASRVKGISSTRLPAGGSRSTQTLLRHTLSRTTTSFWHLIASHLQPPGGAGGNRQKSPESQREGENE